MHAQFIANNKLDIKICRSKVRVIHLSLNEISCIKVIQCLTIGIYRDASLKLSYDIVTKLLETRTNYGLITHLGQPIYLMTQLMISI